MNGIFASASISISDVCSKSVQGVQGKTAALEWVQPWGNKIVSSGALGLWIEGSKLQSGVQSGDKVSSKGCKSSQRACREGTKELEPGSSQWWGEELWEEEVKVINQSKRDSNWKWGKPFPLWEQSSTEADCSGRSCWLHLCKFFKALSNLAWFHSLPCFEQELGLEISQGPFSLNESVILFTEDTHGERRKESMTLDDLLGKLRVVLSQQLCLHFMFNNYAFLN